jgi:hypothetical protein
LDRAKYIVKKMRRHLELIDQAIEEAESDLFTATKTVQLVFGSDPDEICFPLPESEEARPSDSGGGRNGSAVVLGRTARPVVTITNPNPLWGSDEPGIDY